jgi:DNA-binding GntR family transcriptional regulator
MPASTAATEEKQSSGASSNDIADDIASAIAARKLPPGTKLREEALSRLYHVSRTKIRAALLILSKDKLIRIVPDKGAFVSQPSEKESRDIFAARRIIEAALAREFVAKATAADYRRLEKHLEAERRSLEGDHKLRSRLLGDFHVVLAEVVGNDVVREMLHELVARSSLITMLYQSDRDAACSADEHADFIAAARSGDADRAAEVMLAHLTHVEAALRFDSGTRHDKDLVSALLK